MASTAYHVAIKSFKGRLIAPYQNRGVAWMVGREFSTGSVKGGMLCDEMGLGKTAQMIATVLGNPGHKTLIVAPKSVVGQWVGELARWAPHLKVGIWDSSRPSLAPYDVVLSTYGMTMNRQDFESLTPLHRVKWGRIILDEAHEIRNKRSKTHGSIIRIQAPIRWVLSGTPVFNSISDFVSLGEFIGIPGRYVQADPSSVRESYVLRRTKADVSEHNARLALPRCEFDNVELDMYPEERCVYEEAYTCARDYIIEAGRSENVAAFNMNIMEHLLRVRQTMIHPQVYYHGIKTKEGGDGERFTGTSRKFEYLNDSVRSHPKENTLIFCQFKQEMLLICKMFEDLPSIYLLDGSVSADLRENNIRKFNAHPGGAIFVIQIKAGGVGLNLQSATRVYLMAPSWNPATELQAIGRAHRTGQTKQVFVKKLIYAVDEDTPSVEQSMVALQTGKAKISAEVLNDPRIEKDIPPPKRMTAGIRDIKRLFSRKIS